MHLTNVCASAHACLDVRPNPDVVRKLLSFDMHLDTVRTIKKPAIVARSSKERLVPFNLPRLDRSGVRAQSPQTSDQEDSEGK